MPLQTAASHVVPEDRDLLSIFSQLGFVGGPSTIPILRLAFKCAQISDTPLLIEGETGTGKGLLAHAIHRLDAKRNPFQLVTLHCATINDSLAESELFGHRRGSFSGAISERDGLFQAASRGTLFIDDVNDLPLKLQPKLLDVLQRARIRAVGEDREKAIDVRVIAACNRPLAPLIAEGIFRSDLFYRLNVISIQLPALRQRQEDLRPLVLAFARRFSNLYGPIEGVAQDLLDALADEPFPGNLRELENCVQKMLFAKTSGKVLTLEDWKAQGASLGTTSAAEWLRDAARCVWNVIEKKRLSCSQAMHHVEKLVFTRAIESSMANRRAVAQVLKVSERTLYNKIRMFKLKAGGAAADSATSGSALENECSARPVAGDPVDGQ